MRAAIGAVGHLHQQVVAAALEQAALVHLSDHVEVSRLAAARAGGAVRVAEGHRGVVALELGVRRGADFFGEPPVDIDLLEGDELILYGRTADGAVTS